MMMSAPCDPVRSLVCWAKSPDPVVEPEGLQPFELVVAGRGRDDGRAGLLGELDRRHANALGTGMDQHCLASGQVARREQGLLSGPERDRHALQFALDRPALFRIMFTEPCDRDNDERVAATEAVSGYVRDIVQRSFPQADTDALAVAMWALVHGLAFLHLDGKLTADSPGEVADQVSGAATT
jgi:hypothetical protein